MLGVGTQELLVLFLVILILFGADKIPEAARTLGKSIRYFKKAAEDIESEIQQVVKEKDLLLGDKKRVATGIPNGGGPGRRQAPSPGAGPKDDPPIEGRDKHESRPPELGSSEPGEPPGV